MRDYILGFKQEKLVEYKLDINDAMILRYLVDFIDSKAMMTEEFNGETYYWVKYDKVVEDLPSLYMKKDAVYRRMKYLTEIGVLKRYTKKCGGTYSFYRLGGVYKTLLFCSDLDKKTEPSVRKEVPLKDNNTKGYGFQIGTKIDMLNNNIITNKQVNNKCEEFKGEIDEVITYLNKKANKPVKLKNAKDREIIKRLFQEGYKINDLKKVIDCKYEGWRNTDFKKYLRPSTLFGDNFYRYYDQLIDVKGFNNFEARTYDYDELERRLLGWS